MHLERQDGETIHEFNNRIGEDNRRRVEQWARAHPFGRIAECAAALGLNRATVGRHVAAIREEWRRGAR